MPAQDDRWDVVVVGLRDPSHANLVMVAAELAHYASLPAEDVERLLSEDEEVEVLVNLARSEAERAAQELNMLGAVVDLRLAMDDSGVFPVFKPDADRQVGVAVGGIIDDSATPPTMGEARQALPEVEPDPEAHRMRARTPAPATAPKAVDPLDLLPMGDSGVHSLLDDLGGPPGIGEALPAPAPRVEPQRVAPDRPGPGSYEVHRPGAAPQAGRARPAPAKAKPKPKGAKPKGGKPKRQPTGPVLGDIGGGPAEPEAPKLPKRLERATAKASEAPTDLELDFEAVGLSKPPAKGGVPKPEPVPGGPPSPGTSGSNMPRRTRAGNMGGTGAAAGGRAQHPAGLLETLRADAVATAMLVVGGCLVITLIVALQIQRSSARDVLPPLEEELAAALADPAGVEAGELRPPSAIESQIDDELGSMETSFLLWWLALGVPVGLVLSRLQAR